MMRPLDDAPNTDELLPDLLADTRDRTDRAEVTDALDAIDGALTDNIRPLTGAAAMSDETARCGTCGTPDTFPEDPKSECAPYGPGGEPICARCAFGTPEAEAEVKARWLAVAHAHDAIGSPVIVTDSRNRESA